MRVLGAMVLFAAVFFAAKAFAASRPSLDEKIPENMQTASFALG